MSVNIHEFARKFREEYKFLYDNYDRVAGFGEAVDAFDEYLGKNIGGFAEFVGEFAKYQKDILTSDRECAAFMFALESMGVL